MRVTLFVPCLIDQFHPEVAKNVVHVLQKVGVRVHYTDEHICCGQPFFKAGHWAQAISMARRTIRAFRQAEVIVAPSGSCVNMIRHHYVDLFRDEPAWLERARDLSQKVYEFSELLINILHVEDLGAVFKGRVAYHESCQVLRGLGISQEPRQLLRRVRGLELVEVERSDQCCGFGGVFSFQFPHIARALVEEKVRNILASGAGTVVGCEISCLMHIGGYARYQRLPIQTLHLADVLSME
jgi:L-lactate dehydrogenase complex protein LldE